MRDSKNDLSAAFAVPRLFGNVVYGQQGRSGATIDMTPVDEEALMNFLMVARAHKRKVAEILFPDNAKGRVRALQNWINYGWNCDHRHAHSAKRIRYPDGDGA